MKCQWKECNEQATGLTKLELYVKGQDKPANMVIGIKTCAAHIYPIAELRGLEATNDEREQFEHIAKLTAAANTGSTDIDWDRCRAVHLPFTDELSKVMARRQGH